MIDRALDRALDRMREPLFGIVALSGGISLLMSAHWPPMAVPSGLFLVLSIVRFSVASRPLAPAVLALCWFAAIAYVPERMEDHVPLFAVWLVALTVSLRHPAGAFVDAAKWQARMLIGLPFAVAVGWKLYFGTYVNGVTLWTFMLADNRFGPLARVLGLSEQSIADDRVELSELLDGTRSSVHLDAPTVVVVLIALTSVMTLLLEATIAISHLAPDRSILARLRLPSVVFFGVVTYAVVPVVPFAGLLSLLAMTAAGWRRNVLWVLPVLMSVSTTRLVISAF